MSIFHLPTKDQPSTIILKEKIGFLITICMKSVPEWIDDESEKLRGQEVAGRRSAIFCEQYIFPISILRLIPVIRVDS